MRTARSAGFVMFCVVVMAAIVVPSVRAQHRAPADWHVRDVRTVAQQKISPGVLSAIYVRRGDRRAHAAAAGRVQVDRHGRAFVDVRAQVRPELETKFRTLGGVVVSTSRTYDSITGWVPLAMLERLAADPSVRGIEPAQ